MLATLTTFAQDITYSYPTTTDTGNDALAGVFGGAFIFLYVVLAAVSIVSLWKVFTKAGQPGWAALIPIYNVYIVLKIVGRPWWWLLLSFIPIVSFVISIIVAHDLSKSFGQGVGMTVLLVLVPIVGLPLLAFGPYTYHGPSVTGGTSGPAPAPAAPAV